MIFLQNVRQKIGVGMAFAERTCFRIRFLESIDYNIGKYHCKSQWYSLNLNTFVETAILAIKTANTKPIIV